MDKWKNKIINAKQVAELFHEKQNEWLLLEILKTGINGKAKKFKLLANSKNKNDLHDLIIEQDDWNLNKQLVIVHADPNKICEI